MFCDDLEGGRETQGEAVYVYIWLLHLWGTAESNTTL